MEQAKKKRKPLQIIASIFMYLVLFIMFLVILTIIIYVIEEKNNTSHDHYTSPLFSAYVIVSSSMEPEINVKDAVFNHKISAKNIKVGDIITFISGDVESYGKTITHRVIEIEEKEGVYYFHTKGDNNETEDKFVVPDTHILGKMFLKIPKLGYIQEFLSSTVGWVVAIILPCVIIVIYDVLKITKLVSSNKKIVSKLKEKKYQKVKYKKESGEDMKAFFQEYCNIIAYAFMGLIFAFASFYFIVNLYHQSEISKTFIVDVVNEPGMTALQNDIQKIKNLLSDTTSNQDNEITSRFNKCLTAIDNSSIKELLGKQELNIVDIYEFRESYENEVLANCVSSELYWFTTNTQEESIDKDLLNLYLDQLMNNTSYLEKDLLNNSSFYFNTSLVSNISRNLVRDGYYEVISAYRETSSLVVNLMEDISMKGGETYDTDDE